MATICKVCNYSYPDELAACPHCAEAVELASPKGKDQSEDSPVVRLRGASPIQQPTGSDSDINVLTGSDSNIDLMPEAGSAINLSDPSGAPDYPSGDSTSGAHSGAWASLIDEEKQKVPEGSAEAQFDSPSDVDLRQQAAKKPRGQPKPPFEPPPPGEDAVVFDTDDLVGSSSKLGRHEASDSGSILDGEARSSGPPSGASIVRWESLVEEGSPSQAGPSSELHVDSPSDVDILGHAPKSGSESVSDVWAAPPSDVTLRRPPPPIRPKAEPTPVERSVPTMPESCAASDIDLTGESFRSETSDVNLDSDQGMSSVQSQKRTENEMPDSMGSTVNLGGLPRKAEPPSGRELLGEPVESGVDLGMVMGESTSGIGDSMRGSASDRYGESSAVDLGASYGSDSSARRAQPSSGEVAAQLLAQDERARASSDIDMRSAPDSGTSAVNLGELPISEQASDLKVRSPAPTELAAEPERRETDRTSVVPMGRPAGRPSRVMPFLGGGLVGAGIGVGACVVLWLMGASSPTPFQHDLGLTPPSQPGPASASKQPAGLQVSINYLRSGEFEKALTGLQEAGEEPERLAARGEARWLHQLRQQKPGQALKADEEQVKQAAEELKKAGTADALFWLGHIQELTGEVGEAQKTYQSAAERFKDDPVQRRRFQAALDRLESNSPPRPAGVLSSVLPADRLTHIQKLAILLTALQPAGGPDAGNEAGFEFWSAVKLAQQGNFADAIKALDKARAVHGDQRYTRMYKAQNPLSDPTEEIFLRACDEMKNYWMVRERLREKGYLDIAQRSDPVKALDEVPAAKDAAAMKTAADNIKKEMDARAAAEKRAQDLDGQVASAQKKAADAEKAATEALASLKKAKELEDRLKTTDDQLRTADAVLKGVGSRLEAAGVKPDDLARGVDELAGARKKAETAVSNLLAQLDSLRSQIPREQANTLTEILKNRPPLQAPESLSNEPFAAEDHYAAGLRSFSGRDFPAAEKSFRAALENDSQDARYHYFLGLARLQQGRPNEALADFEEGAKLEAKGRPARPAVSAALERVQGDVRLMVNRYRP